MLVMSFSFKSECELCDPFGITLLIIHEDKKKGVVKPPYEPNLLIEER
jgi:hypothetical protein